MFTYHFEQSDGYFSRILSHEMKFTPEEIVEISKEIPLLIRNLDEKCKWLIENKGFKGVRYMAVDLDGVHAEERSVKYA